MLMENSAENVLGFFQLCECESLNVTWSDPTDDKGGNLAELFHQFYIINTYIAVLGICCLNLMLVEETLCLQEEP